jgi:hypothetical protein
VSLESAVSLLADTEVESPVTQALLALAARDRSQQYGAAFYTKLFGLCHSRPTSYEEVARVVKAVFALNPTELEWCLLALVDMFDDRDSTYPPSPMFAYGAILGMFAGINWVDSHQGDNLPYGPRGMPLIFESLLLSSKLEVDASWRDGLPGTSYQARLSQAIRGFVRGGNTGARCSNFYQLLVRLSDPRRPGVQGMKPLGALVTEQMCWAEYNFLPEVSHISGFSDMSTQEKASAMATFYQRSITFTRPSGATTNPRT